MPKSVTLRWPSSATSTFWGLTSRWIDVAAVGGAERGEDLLRVVDRLDGGSGARRRMTCFRSGPDRYSMTM